MFTMVEFGSLVRSSHSVKPLYGRVSVANKREGSGEELINESQCLIVFLPFICPVNCAPDYIRN